MYKRVKLSAILEGATFIQGAMLIVFCQMFQGLCLFKGVRLFQTLEYIVDIYRVNSSGHFFDGDNQGKGGISLLGFI